jgi:hypothetical protein
MKKRVSITLAEAVGAHLKQLRLYLPVLLSPVYPSVQTPTVSFGAILKLRTHTVFSFRKKQFIRLATIAESGKKEPLK